MQDNELVERCWDALAARCTDYPIGALIVDRSDLAAIIRIVQAEQRERDAGIGYRVCAATRHVTLGYKVEAAIRNQEPTDD